MRDRVEAARDQLDTVTRSLGCGFSETKLETGVIAVQLAEAAASSSIRRPILVLGRHRPGEKGGAPDLLRIGC